MPAHRRAHIHARSTQSALVSPGNSLEQTCGFCLQTLSGHDNFVYTLAAKSNGDVISGGEDRCHSVCVALYIFFMYVHEIVHT